MYALSFAFLGPPDDINEKEREREKEREKKTVRAGFADSVTARRSVFVSAWLSVA